MTTIMTWGNSEGTKGRCDARCHGATTPVCKCMCGGRYHGAAWRPGGVEQAVRDTWEEAVQEAEEKSKAEGMKLDTSRLRRFIGLEIKAVPVIKTNGEMSVQGRLPLEVSQ
jgi:hypothetical protein